MPDDLKQNNRDKIYIWISEPTIGSKDLMVDNNIFISQIMGDIGSLFRAKWI